jgi:hypothetical protein
MSRAEPPVTPEVIEQHFAEIANRRESLLEMTYGQFRDRTIDAADLATVMRIASGNDVLNDAYDPDDADSEPPLSSAAINSLTTMTAAVCEWIADDISRTADDFNAQGEES